MSSNQYYSWLFPIADKYRKDKFRKLFSDSLQKDLDKWRAELLSNNYYRYLSPKYGDSFFVIEFTKFSQFAYVYHNANPPTKDLKAELIYENDFSNGIYLEINKLREKIHTPDINEIEKFIGGVKENRKDKLNAIEIEQLKPIIEDSYEDWLKEPTEQTAEWIAKIIYSYRNKEDFYDAWIEKFGDIELIMNEFKKLE